MTATDGPYSIGSDVWPGTSRLVEECGELLQVLGKLIGAGGETEHWDGSDLRDSVLDELADVQAALTFFASANQLPATAIEARAAQKVEQYNKWHQGS